MGENTLEIRSRYLIFWNVTIIHTNLYLYNLRESINLRKSIIPFELKYR